MQQGDILFLCQFFYPEYNSSATLPWDTAKYLSQEGFSVGAMCGYPREYNNSGKMPNQEIKDNVYIQRLHYIQLKRGKKIGRLINYLSFTATAFFNLSRLKNYKCVMVYSNPPILPTVALLANRRFGTKVIFVSYDVYPEVAYASGSLTPGGLAARAMRLINEKLFSKAAAVVALTDEMKGFLVANRCGLSLDKVRVIPNWAHECVVTSKSNYRNKFGFLDDDFIVAYFGNMGVCQDVETFLDAMELLKGYEHIKFFVVGHGGKKEYVARRIAALKNVKIIDFLTGDDFEAAISVSSCGIVSLERGLRGMCAPSKYYSYLQGGLPVISIMESSSYLADEVVREKIGYAIEVGQGKRLADVILELASNKNLQETMSHRAIELYKRTYGKKISLEKYSSLLSDVMGT